MVRRIEEERSRREKEKMKNLAAKDHEPRGVHDKRKSKTYTLQPSSVMEHN